jgi:hypothetical protein
MATSLYRWLVEIRHNLRSARAKWRQCDFFPHPARSARRPSAGCTTMAESDLVTMISWLRAASQPHYALLPRSEYLAKWKAWGLPSPEEASALLAEP